MMTNQKNGTYTLAQCAQSPEISRQEQEAEKEWTRWRAMKPGGHGARGGSHRHRAASQVIDMMPRARCRTRRRRPSLDLDLD